MDRFSLPAGSLQELLEFTAQCARESDMQLNYTPVSDGFIKASIAHLWSDNEDSDNVAAATFVELCREFVKFRRGDGLEVVVTPVPRAILALLKA